MSTRRQSPRTRAYRPEADALETRQLLSGVVTGTDIDGDTWTLRLIGPGSLSVVKQVGSDGKPTALSAASEIDTITFGGTVPNVSRLVGTVRKGANGDGKVFFEKMSQIPSRSERFPSTGFSIQSIDMPNFWLGNTTPGATPGTPQIGIPDGVDTFRFGGVDTTHNRPAATANTQDDEANVTLGLPVFGGTRILIDKAISSTQQAPPATGSTTPRTVQHGVVFAVAGRLELFQANAVEGDATKPPGQFANQNPNASGSGGTVVFSSAAGSQPFFNTNVAGVKGAAGGAIGYVRVGGNATNFTTIVEDPSGNSTDRINTYFIGGETQNAMLIAPGGSKFLSFGKGMDTFEVRSHVIDRIQANRGAVNSNVATDREIGRVEIGGDVVNTKILSGYNQSFSSIVNAVTGQSNSIFGGSTPKAPPIPTNPQPGGSITVHVAGDVSESVFAASVQPFGTDYSSPNAVVLPLGSIHAKVEGTINNATASPTDPTKAFFARHVELTQGPVTPPDVPEAPFPHPPAHPKLPGIPESERRPNGSGNINPFQSATPAEGTTTTTTPAKPAATAAAKGNTAQAARAPHGSTAPNHVVHVGKPTPRGPHSRVTT